MALAKLDDPHAIDNIFYTDDFQKYVIKFYYDYAPNEVYTLEGADYVITGPEFTDPGNEIPEWPVLYGYSPEMISYVKDNMTEIASTDTYTIYRK